jgi:NAD(P)-dependent dehydrogenase (short-subunit alcohol dehydrogenase family)
MPDKVILITGASSGIGHATATLLHQKGYRVFGTSRNPKPDQPFTMLACDVTVDASVKQCVEQVIAQAGRVDVLINNAGVDHLGAFEEASMDDIRALFETNFFGTLRMMRAVLPHMRAQKSGYIINISSTLGMMGSPFMGMYTASKHAMEGYSECLWYELQPFGIHVSLVEPGNINTPIGSSKNITDPMPDYAPHREPVLKAWEKYMARSPSPQPVAKAILRLVESDNPRFRTPVAFGLDSVASFFGRRRIAPDKLFFEGVKIGWDIGDIGAFLQRAVAPLAVIGVGVVMLLALILLV